MAVRKAEFDPKQGHSKQKHHTFRELQILTVHQVYLGGFSPTDCPAKSQPACSLPKIGLVFNLVKISMTQPKLGTFQATVSDFGGKE